MYYTERKPKNENGGGLGTRLLRMIVFSGVCVNGTNIVIMIMKQARTLGGFGRTAHSVVEVRGGACVCMVLGHFAWP